MSDSIHQWGRWPAGLLTSLLLSLVLVACDGPAGLLPTPHQRYQDGLIAAGLDDSRAGSEWLQAAAEALQNPHTVPLPYQEQLWQQRGEVRAEAWAFRLNAGESAEILFHPSPASEAGWFIDLFRAHGANPNDTASGPGPDHSPDHLFSMEPPYAARQYRADSSGWLILRVQGELLLEGGAEVVINRQAAMTPPLAGPVSSPFGAPRDGGRRQHHGVDIFAPRNTPVKAAADGVISRVGNSPRGGRHIWQRSGSRRLYYAHLEDFAVRRGQRVKAGQTIGYVGNSGNASTTAPHLHFGVYDRWRGPVDPEPLIRQTTPRTLADQAPPDEAPRYAQVAVARANLRAGPGLDNPVVRRLQQSERLQVLGYSGSWARVAHWLEAPGADEVGADEAEMDDTGFIATRLLQLQP